MSPTRLTYLTWTWLPLSSVPGFENNWEPRALISQYFGRPAQVYNFGPYTVMVWDRNILSDLPR